MGVFSGSISVSKFYVEGEPPARFHEPFMRNLKLRTFSPLEPDDEEDERCGWCAASNGLDLELSRQKVFYNNYLTLGFRVDKWRIPRPLFKAHFEQALTETLARTGKEKLSKKDTDELKFRITRRLRKKVLPSMRHFDLCWNIETGVVLFWNRSTRLKDDMSLLFEQTFKLGLAECSPYIEAKHLLSQDRLETLQNLERSSYLAAGSET